MNGQNVAGDLDVPDYIVTIKYFINLHDVLL